MRIRRVPDRFEKLKALGSMATDDILTKPEKPTAVGETRLPYSIPRNNPGPGIYRAAMPNGKRINLMRVMFTDFCKMDCYFCPNSHWVPRRRFAFKVDELARTFMDLADRHTVDGLFLSSGVAGSGSKTTERLVQVVETIRKRYGYRGYVHLKVMPGTDYEYVEAAHRLGTRLSVNLETPTVTHMRRLSKMKELVRDIMAPMRWIHDLTQETTGGAVGQVTQLVVGAADENDRDIFRRIGQLYSDWNLKRVYYAPFNPVRHTPLEDHSPTPAMRGHRLYQVDWLKRVYSFSDSEIGLAFDDTGFLSLEHDPKTVIALENLDTFPVDVNSADRELLLRVPGVGPTSTRRILALRRRHTIDTWRDLQTMGVVKKRAWPFLSFAGHRPNGARQLRMDLFEDGKIFNAAVQPGTIAESPASEVAPSTTPASAPCGLTRSCVGCSLYGAPGHPGSPELAEAGAPV